MTDQNHAHAMRGDMPTEEDAEDVIADMILELGIPDPPLEQRLMMRATILNLARLMMARGWRFERPPH